MRVLVACETSGVVRDAFRAAGHDAWSCDLLPAQGDGRFHISGDALIAAHAGKWDMMIAHPPCTYLTNSAAWAFKDGPYHQRVKPGTLTGAARRAARVDAVQFVRDLWAAPIERKCIENPIGALSRLWRRPTQIIQPYQFGEDASKATCLWLENLAPLEPLPRDRWHSPRIVGGRPRWSNQTDSGQNRLSPSPNRWQVRSDTFPKIAAAMAAQWG